jgi:hypothetical protein
VASKNNRHHLDSHLQAAGALENMGVLAWFVTDSTAWGVASSVEIQTANN